MPVFSFEGKTPVIASSAFVAPTATVIGDVTIEDGASVWYGAVLRGDFAPIYIRAAAIVQDGAVLHGPPGMPVEIGEGANIGHLCVIHGATIEAGATTGNTVIVMDGAIVGQGAVVASGAVVTAGTKIEAGMLAAGSPAVASGPVTEGARSWVTLAPPGLSDLGERHRRGVTEIRA